MTPKSSSSNSRTSLILWRWLKRCAGKIIACGIPRAETCLVAQSCFYTRSFGNKGLLVSPRRRTSSDIIFISLDFNLSGPEFMKKRNRVTTKRTQRSPIIVERTYSCASRRSVYDEVGKRSERDGRPTYRYRVALLQHPHQSPTVQWQEDDVQDQYGRQVQ